MDYSFFVAAMRQLYMKEGEYRRRDLPEHQEALYVQHILPKANEIVKTSEQTIKSIYPFELVPPSPSAHLQVPFLAVNYDSKPVKSRFVPPRRSITEHFQKGVVYDKFNYGLSNSSPMNIYSIDKLKALGKNDFILKVQKNEAFVSQQGVFEFDSRFESGNLCIASVVEGLHCLLLHNDVNTSGYTNWFYFSVVARQACKGRFAIMNYGKAGWPMNVFPGICFWSELTNRWERRPCGAVCEGNRNLYTRNGEFDNFNTLYFQYQFQLGQKVFFAYNPPYTYTDLLKTLDSIQQQNLKYFHRKLAGRSLVGNRLQMLTITNFNSKVRGSGELPVVVLMARSHAGETVSSWVMHFLIRFLVSDRPEAVALRDAFVFKIFPMVNPDGVVHGNYRCSLIGRDLNRRWKNPMKELYPQVYFIKNQIVDTHEQRQVKMVIDLHGHTQKRQAFFYGCADKLMPHRARLFPYMTTKVSQAFEFASCNFALQKSKESTARITLYNIIKSPDIFTLQTSQFGLNQQFLSTQAFEDIALSLCRTVARFYHLGKSMHEEKAEVEECEEELLANPTLLKVGCEPSDGSDSQPSVCNLQFDRINKLAIHVRPRPATEGMSGRRKSIARPQSSKKEGTGREQREYSMSVAMSRQIKETGIRPSVKGRGVSAVVRQGRGRMRTPKFQYTREVQSKGTLQQLAMQAQRRPVRMINFQLLIDEGRRKSSMRTAFESTDLRTNHINYHMFQKRCVFRNRSFNWNKNSV